MSARVEHERIPAPRRPSTKEALLQSALELFSERGMHGVAVPEVAQRAGVATGSIYRHFESKEALVNAVYQGWREKQLHALFADMPEDLSQRDVFKEGWVRLARFYRKNPMVFTFLELHHHYPYLDEASREASGLILKPSLAFLKQAQKEGLVKPLPPALLMSLINGMFAGMMKFSMAGHFKLTDDVVMSTEQCCWEAIRA